MVEEEDWDDDDEDEEAEEERFDPREDEIRALIAADMNITQIAKARGVKRQAIWEFCARRGWLGDESLNKIEKKDARRRVNRRPVAAARRAG